MIVTRDAVELRRESLPEHGAGGGHVCVLKQGDKVFVKRHVARGGVVNVVDRYELVCDDGSIAVLPMSETTANLIVDRVIKGEPWSACFVFGGEKSAEVEWVKTEAEHKYTSTGVKFWRHREAMEAYRSNTGRTVISTHISPEGACNLRCPFCSVTYRDTHSRIALPRIQKYVADLQSRGLKAVILTGGGEPTAYPDFNELVQWTKSRGLSVALITNGTLASKVEDATWRCFSWVRVSVNVFDGWKERIHIPRAKLADDCVVGCSVVYTIEHEAAQEDVPLDRVELFRQVSQVADKCGAEYIRVLPNCLLPQTQLLAEHRSIEKIKEQLGDSRFFHQFKVHGAPQCSTCHQSYFRPYLSEEPHVGADGKGDGEPGTVYPCDSVVLNDAAAHFGRKWQLCKPEQVLDYMDGKIKQAFDAKADCTGCVFTGNVDLLDDFKVLGKHRFQEFADKLLVHEEFV